MQNLGIDLNGVQAETNDFGLLPAGEYDVVVDKAEIKENGAKTGYYINFGFKVINSEKYTNRYLWDIVNIKNPNNQAQEIGLARLKRLLEIHKMPVDGSANVEHFIGKEFSVYVKVDKNEEYGDGNKITSYSETKGAAKEEAASNNIPNSWVWRGADTPPPF